MATEPEKTDAGATPPQMSRRNVLALGAGAVVLMGFYIYSRSRKGSPKDSGADDIGNESLPETALIPAYVTITPDNVVELVCPAAEMGQGVITALPALIAEEMEADWARVRVFNSDAGEAYINPGKNLQATGRSMSVRGYFEQLLTVGAEAKARLVRAASETWGVPAAECVAENSLVTHAASGNKATYYELSERAASYEDVTPAPLKSRADYKIIGRPLQRKDLAEKVTGKAVFGADVVEDGMLTATIAMAPTLGGYPASYDKEAALAVRGVRHVVETMADDYRGLAVVADSFWQAKKGLDALSVVFAEGEQANVSTADITNMLHENLASGEARYGRDDGDVGAALGAAARRVSGVFDVPYLAHATMEPMSCFAHVTADACRIIAPTQGPIRVRDAVAEMLGMSVDSVHVSRPYLGGGFGRRWQPDFALQCVEISKAVGAPVKLIWSREEDMRHDYFRQQAAASYEAALDENGVMTAFDFRTSCASIIEWGKPNRLKGRPDNMALSGVSDNRYDIPNQRAGWIPATSPTPVGTWRSVGHSQNGFFMECAIDEIAQAAGADPVQFRKQHLQNDKRMLRVLEAAAQEGEWRPRSGGHNGEGQGVAVAESYGSFCAYVIDVAVDENRKIKIHNVACAMDCGFAVNPDGVAAQIEGSVVFALTAALYGEITIEKGAVVQSNFTDYRMATLRETPPISIRILNSDDEMGGAGEPGFPPFAPALVNAIYAATGERIRKLPLAAQGYSLA
ncbi:MAG: xanthine dehydrogenase family protein molybdopterin-binding subunit [Parvularculaceae bacterium]|nr:xanthine dehydrogenase family protein molybdopterin-binding subunit [Parvularculaceae bacterium]